MQLACADEMLPRAFIMVLSMAGHSTEGIPRLAAPFLSLRLKHVVWYHRWGVVLSRHIWGQPMDVVHVVDVAVEDA